MPKKLEPSQAPLLHPRSVVSEDPDKSLPFLLTGPALSERHWYVGGRPPLTAFERSPPEADRIYFATVPFSTDNPTDDVCSVFISPYEIMLVESGSWNAAGAVRLVVHRPGPRAAEGPLHSESIKSEHGIALLESQDDIDDVGEGWIIGKEGQKFGGRPTFLQREALQDDWEALEDLGFRQLVQFGWPECVSGVTVKGDWPFSGGAFSVAFRRTPEGLEWRWCWQIG